MNREGEAGKLQKEGIQDEWRRPRSNPVLKATNNCARKEGRQTKPEFNGPRKEGTR